MNPLHIIIDSSVAIKWYLPDEHDDKALKIKSDFADGIISIALPVLFFYEISNILRTTSKSLRIAQEDTSQVFQDLLELNFMVYSSKGLFKSALEKALDLDMTTYDASYIVLAEYLQIPLYTADDKLIEKAQSKWVRSLDEYSNGVAK